MQLTELYCMQVVHRIKTSLMSACWAAWRPDSLQSGQLSCIDLLTLKGEANRCCMQVVHRIKTSLLSACWAAWQQQLQARAAKQQQHAAAADFLHKRLLGSCMLTWQAAAREQRMDSALLRKAVQWLQGASTAKVWSAWVQVNYVMMNR